MKEAVWIMMSFDPDRVSGIITFTGLWYDFVRGRDRARMVSWTSEADLV